jgi:subtilisin family serine protease
VVRFVIASSEDLDLVLTRLEGAAKGLRVSPNHVVFGCPEWGFDPYGEPRPMGNSDLPRLPPVPSDGVVVAVIDSGLPMDCDENPLLATVDPPASEEEPWLYRDRWPVLTFPQGHGSFVTGVVRMRAPAAVVASYRALDDDGVTDEWSLAEQIAVAVEAEPQVINLSLGTTTRHDEPLMGLDALRQATLVGSRPIVVAAAGNLATNRPFYPAADDWVIGVAAVEMTGDPPIPVPASFTNYGDWVDACANGVNLTSAYEAHPYRPISPPAAILHFNGAAQWSGTSFAAPMVAAVVAELRATNPAIDREGVLAELAALGPELPGLGMLVS